MSPAPPSPARNSARIASECPAPRFDALNEQLAELGKAEDFDYPLPEHLPEHSDEPHKIHSGSGYQLPALANVQWEENRSGGWEAWHVPPGAVHRREKTYLGYLGLRKLRQWEQESPERFRELVTDWIAGKRREKQIK